MEDLKVAIGNEFLTSSDSKVDSKSFAGVGIVCVYFSAHWCPPCRSFTPKLAEIYTKYNESGKKVEIIFTSRDKDVDSYNKYRKTMPWLALAFENPINSNLATLYHLSGIPTLVVLSSKGKIICDDGYEPILLKGEKAFDEWIALTK
jgi:nucleoredoxin